MINPITPGTAVAHKRGLIPDEVIKAFNDLIAIHFDGNRAEFRQEEAVRAILESGAVPDRQGVFDRHWLDVEPVYRAAGWTVAYDKPGYDKPGYNDPGCPVFTFTRPGRPGS